MKPRIIVLGGGGFIGRCILRVLAADGGFETAAVSRRAGAALAGTGVETHDADASDAERLTELMGSAAAVINCVTGEPEVIRRSTDAVLIAAKRVGAPIRIVHLSSLAAYGSARGRVDESAALLGDLGPYSAAKASSDRRMAEHDGAVILRPGIVFGPGSVWWSDRIARLLAAHRLGDLGPHGLGICNLVYVEDVAAAVLSALKVPGSRLGAFNLGSPVPVTWNEYFARYAAALGSLPLHRISRGRLVFETRVVGPPLKVLEFLLQSPRCARWNPWPPIRPWLTELCEQDIHLDVSKAEHRLGLIWTPIDQALQATATWFRDGGRTIL